MWGWWIRVIEVVNMIKVHYTYEWKCVNIMYIIPHCTIKKEKDLVLYVKL
jgi:hypothetical protein